MKRARFSKNFPNLSPCVRGNHLKHTPEPPCGPVGHHGDVSPRYNWRLTAGPEKETLHHHCLPLHVRVFVSSLLIHITPVLSGSCVVPLWGQCRCLYCSLSARDKAVAKYILSSVRSRKTQIILSLIFSKEEQGNTIRFPNRYQCRASASTQRNQNENRDQLCV